MKLATTFATEGEFRASWPNAVDALQRLHEGELILSDYRYEFAHDALQETKAHASPSEIERALSRFWEFDDRYFGDSPIGGGIGDFRWCIYCSVYLFNDDDLARDLLTAFCPLLGPFAVKTYGELFSRKVCSTFMDDVAHVLSEIQDFAPAVEPCFFDWYGHLNDFEGEVRASLLALSGLEPLKDPSFPPKDLMRVFCPGVSSPVRPDMPEAEYLQDLAQFYEECGYGDISEEVWSCLGDFSGKGPSP